MASALIVAAGSGQRLGADRPKALVEVAGRAMLLWSVEALLAVPSVERIVVALPAGVQPPREVAELAAPAPAPTVAPTASSTSAARTPVVTVEGGATRSQSVRRALQLAGAGDPVLVHDAARPLLTAALAEAVLDALARDPGADAAIAAAHVTDTVKRADSAGAVIETLDRSQLWAVQTPQVFRRAALERALDVPVEQLARATDDAWLVERSGGRVLVVPGGEHNLKVTTLLDLRVAELLLAERRRGPQGADERAATGGPRRASGPEARGEPA